MRAGVEQPPAGRGGILVCRGLLVEVRAPEAGGNIAHSSVVARANRWGESSRQAFARQQGMTEGRRFSRL